MTTITLTYCGMNGQGPTVKEAKQDAARKIESLLSELDDSPIIRTITHGQDKYTMIIFRNSYRWGYELIKHGESDRTHYTSANYDSKDEALTHAFRHIAQNVFTFDNDGLHWIMANDSDGLGNHKSWALWQHRYHAWKLQGQTDEQAHALAHSWPAGYAPTYPKA